MRSPFVVFACAVLSACSPAPVPGASAPASSTGGEASPALVEFGSIEAAIAGRHRSAADRARDPALHPRDTLEFLGVKRTQRLVELWPDDGYYSELLAPLVHDEGALISVVPEGAPLESYLGLLQSSPEVYDRVELVTVSAAPPLSFGSEASADLVLSFDDFHAWLTAGIADTVLTEIARVLKPGAVYGVVEPRARPGTSREVSLQTGYVPEELVIAAALRAGLVLEGRSQVNANQRDTKEHPAGAVSTSIGEPDRMTLRFRKPAID